MSDFDEYYRDQIFSSALPPYKPPAYSELAHADFHACLDCGDSFILGSSLNLHLSRQSVDISYYCKKCDHRLNFQNRCSLLAHLRQHPESSERNLPVTISPLPVENIGHNNKRVSKENDYAELSRYKNTVTERDSSSQGGNILSSDNKPAETPLLEPLKSNSSGKSIKCRECDSKVENLKSHFLGDNKPSNPCYKCQTCDHILPSKCNLKAHMRIHSKKVPFVCPDCMKEFAFYELFMVHLRYFCFHLDKCARFKCQACPGVFPTLTSLEVHHATKHVKPVFKCVACPRAFFEQRLLSDHKLQSHGGLKVDTKFFEQCQLCPQKLLTKNSLFFHIHEHVVNKNVCFYCYKCSNCKYITDTKLNFASHRLICPSSEKDMNAHALAKLAKSTISGERENSFLSNRKPVAICHPHLSPSNLIIKESHRKPKTSTSLWKVSSGLINKKTSSSKINPGQRKYIVGDLINSRIQKLCSWHPKKCLMCQNESNLGRIFARYNCPPTYEGCLKWKGPENKDDTHIGVNAVPKINHFNLKNRMAFNGPSYRSKNTVHESGTYLCHVCNQSLQINPSFIQKHFRQEHPDVELMTLYPLIYKFDLPKITKVPLDALKFSLKKGKFYQTVTVKTRIPAVTDREHEDGRRNLLKLKKSMAQSNSSVKSWMICSKCTFKTKSRVTYKKHMLTHKQTSHECPECGMRFSAEPSLKKHFILQHKGESVMVRRIQGNVSKEDDFVQKSYDEESGLEDMTEELSVESENSDSKLSCKVCRKTFDCESDLQKHFRIHGMAFLLLNKDEKVWRKV